MGLQPPVRKQAAQQEVSSGWAKPNLSFPITPIAPYCSPLLTLLPNHHPFPHPPESLEELSSKEPVTDAEKVGNCCPMDYSPPSSSVHGIILARILEWVAISSSRGSFSTQRLNQCLSHLLYWQGDSLPWHYLGSASVHPWLYLKAGVYPREPSFSCTFRCYSPVSFTSGSFVVTTHTYPF